VAADLRLRYSPSARDAYAWCVIRSISIGRSTRSAQLSPAASLAVGRACQNGQSAHTSDDSSGSGGDARRHVHARASASSHAGGSATIVGIAHAQVLALLCLVITAPINRRMQLHLLVLPDVHHERKDAIGWLAG
jgi:hypothetical protein